MSHFYPAKTNALERRGDCRCVFSGELEVDQVRPIAKGHIENVGNYVECSHDRLLLQRYCMTCQRETTVCVLCAIAFFTALATSATASEGSSGYNGSERT